MRIGAIARTVAINAAIVIGAYLVLLLLVSAFLDVRRVAGKAFSDKVDERADSPAYEDHKLARQILADQKASDYQYVAFVGWRQKPFTGPTLTIGPDGNRRHTAGTQNLPGARTMGMFGSSVMWGTGADDNSTIPAFFDQITDQFTVTNYGERGFTSRQSLALLINLINTGQMPQVVVFYSGYNDVWTHCNYAVTQSLNGHMEERKIRAALEERDSDARVYGTFVLPVLKLLAGRDRRGREFVCEAEPQRAEAVASMMVETWEIARQLVEGRGGQFYLFLQPSAYVGQPNVSYVDLGGRREGRDRQFATVYPLVRRKLAERNARWAHDLSNAFDGTVPIYIDDGHVAPRGNRIIAERMREVVLGRAQ